MCTVVSSDLCLTIVPCVHGSPSSCYTYKVDLYAKMKSVMSIHVYISIVIPLDKATIVNSIIIKKYQCLLNFGSKPFTGLLKSRVVTFSNLGPSGVDGICNKAIICVSISFKTFFNVSFTNFMCVSACPLL